MPMSEAKINVDGPVWYSDNVRQGKSSISPFRVLVTGLLPQDDSPIPIRPWTWYSPGPMGPS